MGLPTGREPARKILGGITIWGVDAGALDLEVSRIRAAIEGSAKAQLSVVKAVLKKLAEERLGDHISDTVFSGVLGWSLRCGVLDSAICGSKNDRPFRIIIHKDNLAKFRAATDAVKVLLERENSVAVRDVEKVVFSSQQYNTFSSSLHILGVLSYLGFAEFVDDDVATIATMLR